MLFSIKNRPGATLAALLAFAALACGAQALFGLPWDLRFGGTEATQAVVVCIAIVASDAILHGWFILLFGDDYRSRYRALVDHFRPQGAGAIAAGSLLAGLGEEPFFRGAILQGTITLLGAPPAFGVAVSALAFGALHAIPDRALRPFALWAVWEGILLGSAYVVTDSLAVVMIAHSAHDAAGFALFALQRKTGWLLARPRS